MKTKILIILIILVGLGVGWVFISATKGSPEPKRRAIEPQIYKGIWMSTLLLQDPNHLASNVQKLKDMGVNTIFLQGFPPFSEAMLKKAKEIFPPELFEKSKEVLPIEKELMIDIIQTAHRNGLKVALTVGTAFSPEEKYVET